MTERGGWKVAQRGHRTLAGIGRPSDKRDTPTRFPAAPSEPLRSADLISNDPARRNAHWVNEEVRTTLQSGNATGALKEWAWFFNELSKDYANRTGNESAFSAMEAIISIASLLPQDGEYAPARALIDDLLKLVTELPTGKRTHKLFDWNGIVGTWDKGSPGQQVIVGQSLACLALLEHFTHRRGASVIADALGNAGYSVAAATVRDWKKRKLRGWPLAWEAYADGMNNLPRVIAENDISDAKSAEAFVKRALKIAVATHL